MEVGWLSIINVFLLHLQLVKHDAIKYNKRNAPDKVERLVIIIGGRLR